MYKIILFFVILLFSTSLISSDIYGGLDPAKYLTGHFRPSKHKDFVKLSKHGIPTNNRAHYLRKETALALKKMIKSFNSDFPKIRIYVVSSTRNFNSQRYIWEAKWTGRRRVDGQRLNHSIRNKEKRALKILNFSSMPGTSRHHWGTDFDINSLENSYYKKGNGKIIYSWLKKNGYKYGFGQPYIAGRMKGYNEERWHWSYLPVAKRYLKDWNTFVEYGNVYFNRRSFKGAEISGNLAPIYVNSINSGCK